jgi:ankyrin repeat protein
VTPLLRAFQDEKFYAYRTLLELGANPNVIADNGDALMVYAACTRDSKWLREALEHGGNPNLFNANAPPRHRGTPLISAIQAHCTECASMLIKAGADVNYLPDGEPSRETPLVAALWTNNYAIILELLNANADYRSKQGSVEFLDLLRKRLSIQFRRKERVEERDAVLDWLRERGVEVEEQEPEVVDDERNGKP